MNTSHRRWPAFSLRTLFVVVTALACWLGYSLDWIRQRHALLDSQVLVEGASVAGASAPLTLWVFGEPGHGKLLYLNDWVDEDSAAAFGVLAKATPSRRLSDGELRAVRALFPEATIRSLTRDDPMTLAEKQAALEAQARLSAVQWQAFKAAMQQFGWKPTDSPAAEAEPAAQ